MNKHLKPVPVSPPAAVIYLRQSVARDDSISLELQEIACRDYATKQGYEVVAVEVDEGISGRTWTKRPAVQRVLDLIENKNADIILLWKWSRLSRSRKDWALAADRVDIAGGRIESATEPIDTATASGRFARGVMTEYAAFQSEQIGEQWAEVRARRFNLGLPPTGSVPWGWKSFKTHIVSVPEQAEYVKQMYEKYVTGTGFAGISAWLNKTDAKTVNGRDWIPATVKKILESPIHAGYVTYKGELREGAHEGIISQQMWDRYQSVRKDRHIPTKIRESKYLLSSLMVCHCGRKMYGKKWLPKHKREFHYSYTCPTTTGHKTKSLKLQQVEAAVTGWLKTLPTIVSKPEELTDHVDTEILAREITKIEQQLVKLTEHLLSGLVPETTYETTKSKLLKRSNELQTELSTAQRAQSLTPGILIAENEELIGSWELLEFEDKRRIARTLIKSVTLLPDKKLSILSVWDTTTVIDT